MSLFDDLNNYISNPLILNQKLAQACAQADANAANVPALAGTLTGTVDGTINNVAAAACAGGADPTAAQVDTAVAALALSTNLALKEIQTTLNLLLAAMKTAGLMTAD